MSGDAELFAGGRLAERFAARAGKESAAVIEALRARPDCSASFGYFLELAATGSDPESVSKASGRRVVNLLCVQAPLELISAAGLHPLKIYSGSPAAWNVPLPGAPALMCPMLKAAAVALGVCGGAGGCWVIPTTCDWVVKFPEIASYGARVSMPDIFWMELPHLKETPGGQMRWLDETYRLKDFLESAGDKITRKSLEASIGLYNRAWLALSRLSAMRSSGSLSSVWFMLIAGTLFLGPIERWTAAAEGVINALYGSGGGLSGAPVFLAGSPIFFPNFKLPLLLEEAGLQAVADDLCSAGRALPNAVTYFDPSESGMISAIAERYHQACLCPTFIDNGRRINNIIAISRETSFRGVVFHLLKGCHPYDIESGGLEKELKKLGFRFIRIETDYTPGDGQNLLARLEAFRSTAGSDPNGG